MSPHSKAIAAVILAAGESSRFRGPKQLLQFEAKTLIRRIVDAAREANCSPVIVVTGNADAEVQRELRETNAITIQNKDWKAGIGTSIRTGIQRLIDKASDVDSAVLLVCDQPFVDADVLSGLIALHSRSEKPIVASAYASTLGVPALFARSMFQELLQLSGDSGAKTIIFSNRERVAEFAFPKGRIDLDTIEDFESLAKRTSGPRLGSRICKS
jgi:molybdenum cofactor cytidylyltransferase